MGTNVYGTGSIKTWKTRHIVSEDIWIFLQCIVGRTSKVAWSFSWMTSRTSLRVVGDCEWLALNLSHSLNKQLATTSAGKLRPPVPTAGMATVLSWRLCAASRTFLTKWRTTWTTMWHLCCVDGHNLTSLRCPNHIQNWILTSRSRSNYRLCRPIYACM